MIAGEAGNVAGRDSAADLDWLADRFVLGELSAADEGALVDRLAHDDALAAAVARSSRLLAALRPSRSVPASLHPRAVARRRLMTAVAAVAAAATLVACWPAVAPRFAEPLGDGSPREVVRLWRQADDAGWSDDEPLTEDEPAEGDTVPDWMLAAVGLDSPATLESNVQEN